MNAQQIDDKPQDRESDVRHAHAVEASRHGRASTPGYLGLPADEDPEGPGVDGSDGGASQDDDRPRRPSAGRARGRAAGSGGSQQSRSSQSKASSRSKQASQKQASRSKAGSQPKASRSAARAARPGGRPAPSGKRETPRAGSGKATPDAKRSRSGDGASSKGRSAKSSAGGRRPPSTRASGGRTKAAAASITSKVASIGESGEEAVRGRARREAVRIGGALLKRALIAGSRAAVHALTRAGQRGADGLLESVQRLPIQQSIDVAAPPEIAWQQWMELRHLPEGAHRLTDVERDGDELHGVIARRGTDWSAEIIDEREQESFAWQSTEGSDSAGLVTFHPLGERLTRVELTLDVQPEDLGEAALLLLHIADRRVREELRRFKADTELLNPDIYEELLESDDSNGTSGTAGEQ